jgi:4-phosphopantoate---beta-alanine ligase
MKLDIPIDHPRYHSLLIREKLVHSMKEHIVAEAGLIAHGRGEAFDYLFSEATNDFARAAIEAATCALLDAKNPVISVNGNVASLIPEGIVELAQVTGSKIEVNLFYRTEKRERAIAKILSKAGARKVYGIGKKASGQIPELGSERRRVDPEGIGSADVILVPLEDGDRTEALVKLGKTVIAIDLNPLSRTSEQATITIVDNLLRAVPLMIEEAKRLKALPGTELERVLSSFNNRACLMSSLKFICERLASIADPSSKTESGEHHD